MVVQNLLIKNREKPCGARNFAVSLQHSTAQHSTAQHSTAQHSTAQHSTAHFLLNNNQNHKITPARGFHVPEFLYNPRQDFKPCAGV
jgi:hypothetical protein